MQLQRPVLVQEQRLKISHQVLQSIKLMEMPIMDLREKIAEEMEKNPALDILEDRTLVSLDAISKANRENDEYSDAGSDHDYLNAGKSTADSWGGDGVADEHHRFIEGLISRPETLQDHLLWQLRLETSPGEIRRIGELLIGNLDSDGFHAEPAEILMRNESPELFERAMRLVQSLDPHGCCTLDYRESLAVQIGLLPDAPPGLAETLDCLDLLERGKIAEAAKKMGRTEDEVLYFFERIKELSPFPGRSYATANAAAETRFVVPDIEVIRKEDDFSIILNSEEIPVLGLNPFFMKMAGEKDKTAKNFVLENIREARWFIQAISERNHTLLRITRAVVVFQRSFFINGPRQLAPLTQRDIAKELGINESTVSRTANGKYVQTEWGIFELRHFFTNSISGQGSGGSKYSKEGVKEILREIISEEGHACSDQEITRLLARQGIPLARRTVAKYRKELELASSYSR